MVLENSSSAMIEYFLVFYQRILCYRSLFVPMVHIYYLLIIYWNIICVFPSTFTIRSVSDTCISIPSQNKPMILLYIWCEDDKYTHGINQQYLYKLYQSSEQLYDMNQLYFTYMYGIHHPKTVRIWTKNIVRNYNSARSTC